MFAFIREREQELVPKIAVTSCMFSSCLARHLRPSGPTVRSFPPRLESLSGNISRMRGRVRFGWEWLVEWLVDWLVDWLYFF